MTRYWGIRFKKGPKVFITFIFQKSPHLSTGPQSCFASLSNHYSTFFGLWSKSTPFIKGHKILRHSSRKISLFSVLMIYVEKSLPDKNERNKPVFIWCLWRWSDFGYESLWKKFDFCCRRPIQRELAKAFLPSHPDSFDWFVIVSGPNIRSTG